MRAVRVDAIINEPMMHIFANVRRALHLKLGRTRTREAWLWHGTEFANLGKICTSGFDRSFGAVERYGHGIYFARDANYSVRDRYSPPESNGVKYMILARVLVGEAIQGEQRFTTPQPKPPPRELENYESFVDDVNSPSIVVATRDFMAIPEAIVAFVDDSKPLPASVNSPLSESDIIYDIGVELGTC
jgi:poly [ADP-ribose] polymerase 10/14/15